MDMETAQGEQVAAEDAARDRVAPGLLLGGGEEPAAATAHDEHDAIVGIPEVAPAAADEVNLDALEDVLTVDEAALQAANEAKPLTLSEAELSALAQTAPTEPTPEQELDPAAAELLSHATSEATTQPSAPVVAAAATAQFAPAATTPSDHGVLLNELTQVQHALQEVLATQRVDPTATLQQLEHQLAALTTEVRELRTVKSAPTAAPILVEARPAPAPASVRRTFVVAADHLLLIAGGYALLAWSVATLFAGSHVRLSLFGVIAANLAFAAAILRSRKSAR